VAEAVTYKKPRKFNIVVVGLLATLVLLAYLAYTYLPLYFRKSEVMRVLDETSSEFTSQAGRMLAERKLIDHMLSKMRSDIQALGVSDPNAEYWIEAEDENNVRFGALYSDWIELPWGDKEVINELEMTCSRPGRGTGWTCEGREIDSEAIGDELPVDPNK
jgi:hypothetical protein